jgi:hypothetical protein
MPSREFPHGPDDPVDPALAPLIEAGQGEQEGYELAEEDLIEHASHGDEHSTDPIFRDASLLDEEATDVDYGEADSEERPDL